jgi:hypothetical protein
MTEQRTVKKLRKYQRLAAFSVVVGFLDGEKDSLRRKD